MVMAFWRAWGGMSPLMPAMVQVSEAVVRRGARKGMAVAVEAKREMVVNFMVDDWLIVYFEEYEVV